MDAPASQLKTGTEHVLLVDDEPTLLDLGREVLESLGYRVTVASTPAAALEKLAARPDTFDLLLTDQTMPQMTGDVLAKKGMDLRPGFPVIISTGNSEILGEDKASTLGVGALLMKPVNRSVLSTTIRQVLDASVRATHLSEEDRTGAAASTDL